MPVLLLGIQVYTAMQESDIDLGGADADQTKETSTTEMPVIGLADEAGLMYMARAGYDPREAVGFWTRMSQLGGGGQVEFLSTHPSGENRIKQLNELMPNAMEVYRQSGKGGGP